MASSIEAVYMVEASPALRDAQKKLLCGDAPMTETAIGHQSISKYANLPMIWTENIRFVPSGKLSPHYYSQISSKFHIRARQNTLHSSPRILRRPPNPRLPIRFTLRLHSRINQHTNRRAQTLSRSSSQS